MKITYTKLVRDKIPEILDEKGITYEKSICTSDAEYKAVLIDKLKEEVEEFFTDKNTEELADILEVVYALQTLDEFSNLESIQKKKLLERGGFQKRIIVSGSYTK